MRLLSHLYLNDWTLSETRNLSCINNAHNVAVNVLKYYENCLIIRELQLSLSIKQVHLNGFCTDKERMICDL